MSFRETRSGRWWTRRYTCGRDSMMSRSFSRGMRSVLLLHLEGTGLSMMMSYAVDYLT